MDDGPRKIKIFPDQFNTSIPSVDAPQNNSPSTSQLIIDNSLRYFLLKGKKRKIQKFQVDLSSIFLVVVKNRFHSRLRVRRKLRGAAFMLNLFTLRGMPWGSSTNGQEKVELTATELASLRSELADLEEREAHLKAQLEHVDEILRSARLSGYLYIRTRWTALPGEPPPIDDTDVDDWLPRFIVLHGPCIFFYFLSTDLSPLDSTLLSDVVEVGSLPYFLREDGETRYCLYILTRHGLRYECSSSSKIQVDTWLSALQRNCKLVSDTKLPSGSSEV